jgi:hypothetical protein
MRGLVCEHGRAASLWPAAVEMTRARGAAQARVQRFQTSDIPVFLLTSQVGGLGLTLTAADRVVIVVRAPAGPTAHTPGRLGPPQRRRCLPRGGSAQACGHGRCVRAACGPARGPQTAAPRAGPRLEPRRGRPERGPRLPHRPGPRRGRLQVAPAAPRGSPGGSAAGWQAGGVLPPGAGRAAQARARQAAHRPRAMHAAARPCGPSGAGADGARPRLITCGTVEEKAYRKQVFKGGLSRTGTSEGVQFRYFSQTARRALTLLAEKGPWPGHVANWGTQPHQRLQL